jgi:SAM-dependent methyltransferase
VNSAPQEARDFPLLDVRPETDFLRAHEPGAASIPLEELSARIHELPPADAPLRVIDADPQRAHAAAEFLSKRGQAIETVPWQACSHSESGQPRARLWRPNPFLVESLELIRATGPRPNSGIRALDVACGTGRDAVYLALQQYDVLAVDILPDALDRAADLARRNGVAIQTQPMDVESSPSLPIGAFDLVTVFRFLHRPLFPLLREAVAPGGFIVYETFHEKTLATGGGPKNPAHLLETGELTCAFQGFEVLICREAHARDGRFFSSLLARRPWPGFVAGRVT